RAADEQATGGRRCGTAPELHRIQAVVEIGPAGRGGRRQDVVGEINTPIAGNIYARVGGAVVTRLGDERVLIGVGRRRPSLPITDLQERLSSIHRTPQVYTTDDDMLRVDRVDPDRVDGIIAMQVAWRAGERPSMPRVARFPHLATVANDGCVRQSADGPREGKLDTSGAAFINGRRDLHFGPGESGVVTVGDCTVFESEENLVWIDGIEANVENDREVSIKRHAAKYLGPGGTAVGGAKRTSPCAGEHYTRRSWVSCNAHNISPVVGGHRIGCG